MIAKPADVLDFWIAAGPKRWWKKNEDFDAEIRDRFWDTYQAAIAGELEDWLNKPNDALALIIVLDQFSRNLFRNDPRAFTQDEKTAGMVHALMTKGLDRKMRQDIGEFVYLPLMHSENLQDQQICLREMQRVDKEGNIKAAREHLDIIERFGRFPHRNDVLGRPSTPEEIAFLKNGGFSG